MFCKSIFQGRLDFNNERSFKKAQEMFVHKLENSFKPLDILFEIEDLFDEENRRISIPRTVKNVMEKSFKSTVSLLDYMSQFAISGSIGAWLLDEGRLKHHFWIEPKSDKSIVQSFLKGQQSLDSESMDEALDHLDKVIGEYDKHSQAYERRGYINYKLGRDVDAKRDFIKSITVDPNNSLAHLGLGKVLMREGNVEEAQASFEAVTKTAIALQDIHWTARRLLAECYIHMEMWDKASFELKFFTNRKFKKDTANARYLKKSWYLFGKVLLEQEKFSEALTALDKALSIEDGSAIDIQEAEILLHRGRARKSMGKTGFIADWKKASDLGLKDANVLLGTVTAS